MIQQGMRLTVADNSGAKIAYCIKVLRGSRHRYATLGNEIVISVKKAISSGNVKEGDVCKAVVVRTCRPVRRYDGSYIKFDDNAVVLLSENGEMKGSRIFGPITSELHKYGDKYSKILSLAPEVL